MQFLVAFARLTRMEEDAAIPETLNFNVWGGKKNTKAYSISNIYKYVRRLFYWHFKRDHVLKSLARRKGKCSMHGCCAEAGCKYLKDNKCTIYDYRPINCRIYPFDEKDMYVDVKGQCSYYWEKEK